MGLHLGPLPAKGTLVPVLGGSLVAHLLSSPKVREALPTCPCLQVQLLQHNVEKEEDSLHELGDGIGVSRAPGKGERAELGLMANSGPGAPLLKPA